MESVRRFFKSMITRVTGAYDPEESELPKYTFYDTIEEFGYHFNDKEELVDENGGRFQFVVRENDRNYNQQHYDALGELITEYLYTKMETDLQLHKVFIPLDAKKEEPQGFIFQSTDASQCQTLMVIVNGAGVVRAGQWSRKLIINEGLETGSQLPYIRRAREAGFGVVVLNTNQNQQTVNGKATDIRGSGSAEDHGLYVWEHIISRTKATNIVIVAHSYGGLVTCNMAEQFLEDFKKRVFCIVFTDSIHMMERDRWSAPLKEFLKERAVNFASTYVPLDYMMEESAHSDCLSVSAGTEEHERTSHACIDSAFRLIHDNHATWTADGSMAPRHFLPLPKDLSQFSCATRWQRKLEKAGEAEREDSSSVDDAKPATSTSLPETKKRSAADAGEEKEGKGEEKEEAAAATESISKNGGRNEGGVTEVGSRKDEEAPSPAEDGGGRIREGGKGDAGRAEEETLSKNGTSPQEKKTTPEPSCEQETPAMTAEKAEPTAGDTCKDSGSAEQETPAVTSEKSEGGTEDEGKEPDSATVSTTKADGTEPQHSKESEETAQAAQQAEDSKTEETTESGVEKGERQT